MPMSHKLTVFAQYTLEKYLRPKLMAFLGLVVKTYKIIYTNEVYLIVKNIENDTG